jgi:hypothetical protein
VNTNLLEEYINMSKITFGVDYTIQELEIPDGLKELLTTSGFTFDSIISSDVDHLSSSLGIERDVAKIILEAAKKLRKD